MSRLLPPQLRRESITASYTVDHCCQIAMSRTDRIVSVIALF